MDKEKKKKKKSKFYAYYFRKLRIVFTIHFSNRVFLSVFFSLYLLHAFKTSANRVFNPPISFYLKSFRINFVIQN